MSEIAYYQCMVGGCRVDGPRCPEHKADAYPVSQREGSIMWLRRAPDWHRWIEVPSVVGHCYCIGCEAESSSRICASPLGKKCGGLSVSLCSRCRAKREPNVGPRCAICPAEAEWRHGGGGGADLCNDCSEVAINHRPILGCGPEAQEIR